MTTDSDRKHLILRVVAGSAAAALLVAFATSGHRETPRTDEGERAHAVAASATDDGATSAQTFTSLNEFKRHFAHDDSSGAAAAPPPAWNEVEASVRDSILGEGFGLETFVHGLCEWDSTRHHRPDFTSPKLNPERVPLSASRIDALHRIADSFDEEVEMHAWTVAATLQAALEDVWARGAFRKTPAGSGAQRLAAETAAPQKAKGQRYHDTFTERGWVVNFEVSGEEYPDYQSASDALGAVVDAREAALRDAIASSTAR